MKKFLGTILLLLFVTQMAFADIDYQKIYEDLQPPDFSYIHSIDPDQYYDMQHYAWSPYPLFRLNSEVYFKNQTTIMPVAEARGVILMALEKFGAKTYEYTPMEVKQVLTGFGRASKKEVEQMVKIALERDDLPKLDDTIDSIAIAICHTRNCRDLITK